MAMDHTPYSSSTGLTIPLNFMAAGSFVLSKIFTTLSMMPLANLALYVSIVSGIAGTGYVLYKWYRDIVKNGREDEEYEEQQDKEQNN
jgi:hypothetical protein